MFQVKTLSAVGLTVLAVVDITFLPEFTQLVDLIDPAFRIITFLAILVLVQAGMDTIISQIKSR